VSVADYRHRFEEAVLHFIGFRLLGETGEGFVGIVEEFSQ
jgi:hypothetical protein